MRRSQCAERNAFYLESYIDLSSHRIFLFWLGGGPSAQGYGGGDGLKINHQQGSIEPARSVSSTWCVCVLGGGICLCKWMVGMERGSPHSSPVKHFQKGRRNALPILAQPHPGWSEGGIYPGICFLGSNPAQCTALPPPPSSSPLCLSFSHILTRPAAVL